jgi:hypothetical protein
MIEFLLPIVPLLFLVVSLLLGWYPGCDAVVRLSERIVTGARARGTATRWQPRPRPPGSHAAHGGLLLALSLSGRSPPA